MRDRVAAEVPGITIVDLPGGHSINIEAAAGFDEAIRSLVARTTG
jgi:hypothetical protein